MSLVIYLSLIINILAIVSLLICMLYGLKKDVNPKTKAFFGVSFAIIFHLYLLSMAVSFIYGLFIHRYMSCLLLIFIILPFVIGSFSTYEKKLKYSVFQQIAYCFSFLVLVKIFLL